jgi:hypothetical protein
MNTRRFNLLVLLVATAFVFAVWRLHRARQDTERVIADVTARREQLTQQLQQRESELARATARLSELPSAPSTPPPAPEAAAPGPRAANSLVEWLEDPRVQVLYHAKQRADLRVAYGPFFRVEHLTAAQVDRLADLIVQWRAHQHDMSEINRQKKVAFDDPAMVAERARGEAEFKAGVTEVLGEAGYSKLKDYARALEIREYVGRLAGAAAIEGEPLTLPQADALALALAKTCADYNRGGSATQSKIDWPAAEQSAQAILSSAQFKLLRQGAPGATSSKASMELSTAVHRAMREIGLTRIGSR